MAVPPTSTLPQHKASAICQPMGAHRSPLKTEWGMRAMSALQPPSPCRFKRPNRLNSAHPDLNTYDIHEFAVKDLQEVTRHVPLQAFFKPDGLLPPLPKGVNMENIFKVLQGGSINPLDQGGKWKGFNHEPDAFVGVTQHTLYASLPRIIERIVDASGFDRSKRTLIFECNPIGATSLHARDDTSKPDCVGRLATATASYKQREWIDVAVPGEFKRLDTTANPLGDYAKVLWSGQHILREDPRRRFAYGFTMEGWNMRVWYMNRSDVFVSWAMNINKDHKEFVEFFLRLTFASTYQLGWDPTIRRRPLTGSRSDICYDIDLNGKTYRTLTMLSNVGAEALRGRGTHVWEVKELSKDGEEDPNGPVLVLKDSWVDRERTREGEILKKILEDAGKKSEYLPPAIEATLMKALTWGDVKYKGKRDDTFTEKEREKVLQKIDGDVKVKIDLLTKRIKVASRLPVAGGLVPPDKKGQAAIRYTPKVHHRIIFAQVGKRLTDLTSLAEVFARLAEVLVGLQALHSSGWVHRDISIGNILVVNDFGKITDVEYAKPEEAPTHANVRTGTEYFMSPEVEYRTYAHYYKFEDVSKPQPQPGGSNDKFAAVRNNLKKVQDLKNATPNPNDASRPKDPPKAPSGDKDNAEVSPPFRNNPLHDIESVFWVALWIHKEKWDRFMAVHEEFAADLFLDARFRQNVMLPGFKDFVNRFSTVLPRLRPIGTSLNKFRILLITTYQDAESDLEDKKFIIPFDVADPIYGELIQIFIDIAAELKSDDLVIAVKDSNIPLRVVKRAPKPDTAAAAPGSKSSSKARSASHADHDETARPAKSQKTALASSAGTDATRALPTRTMQTRSKAKTLPKRGGKPGGSGRR